MYGGYDEVAPGPSHRPWSPPTGGYGRRSADFAPYAQRSRRREREASEVSVEALDLADYGRTMNRYDRGYDMPGALPTRYEQEYPPQRPYSAVAERPPYGNPFTSPPMSPDPHARLSPAYTGAHSPSPPRRPYSNQTRDSYAPSLVSGETAPSSQLSHDQHYYSQFNPPRRTSAPPPAHPDSDPGAAGFGFGRRGAPPLAHVHKGIFAPGGPQNRSSRSLPQQPAPQLQDPEEKIDTRNFPRFTRGWYDNGTKSKMRNSGGPPIVFPDFDGTPSRSSKYNPYASPPSYASGSQREFLPWGSAQDEGEYVPDVIKEERLRQLEREFGSRPPRPPEEQEEEEEEERIVGSVNERGDLITPGPRKRLLVRITEVAFSFGIATAGIYAALVIKANPPAPPSGTIPPIVLDVLAVLSFLVLMYIIVFRRCCGRNKAAKAGGMGMPGMPGGLMVLPVQQGPGKKKKKPKKGQPPVPGDIQVNLIVDPNSFLPPQQPRNSRRRGAYSELSGDADDDDAPAAPPRKSFVQLQQLEATWLRARSFTKKIIALDVILALLWGGIFGWATFVGANCPPGKYDGWCDAYNISLAGSCLLVLLFLASAFFGFRDLSASSKNPRTRTRA